MNASMQCEKSGEVIYRKWEKRNEDEKSLQYEPSVCSRQSKRASQKKPGSASTTKRRLCHSRS